MLVNIDGDRFFVSLRDDRLLKICEIKGDKNIFLRKKFCALDNFECFSRIRFCGSLILPFFARE